MTGTTSSTEHGPWRYAVKRAWYRDGRPGRLAQALNRISAWQYAHGILTLGGRGITLEVRGRRTGKAVRLPLVLARHDGERYLVSMLGPQAQWVLNVQADDGRALVLRRRGPEHVRLVEVPVADRAPPARATSTSPPAPARTSPCPAEHRSSSSPPSQPTTRSSAS